MYILFSKSLVRDPFFNKIRDPYVASFQPLNVLIVEFKFKTKNLKRDVATLNNCQ